MTAQLCHRCHRWWCHNAGNPNHFVWVTRICPVCVESFPKAVMR